MTDERGSVSLLVPALLVVIAVLALGMLDLWQVLATRSQAQAAADAAALAAAQSQAVPTELLPQEAAAAFAAANGAALERCTCAPGDTEATVDVRLAAGELTLVPDGLVVTATARATVASTGP